MNAIARDAALAILTRAEEREGRVNKTKLLKLLYLADIEHHRKHGETLTGFDWIFHLYGPWTAEYEELIQDLARTDHIEIEQWNKDELIGNLLRPLEKRDLNIVISDTDEYFRVLRTVDTWTERSLPDLLNYVYFETEPMSGAISSEPLSFQKVSREAPQLYKRKPSGTDTKMLRQIRARLKELQAKAELKIQKANEGFQQPIYDDVYDAAINELNREEIS